MQARNWVRNSRISVIGVLNVTPDSFSDGGLHPDLDTAIAHAHQLRAEGADYVDVGGESTRPGAYRIDADEEMRRVLPVITELSAAGVPVSIDTYRARNVRPYLQIGFMPEALSSAPAGTPYQHRWRPGFDYKAIIAGWAYPPKDYAKWRELVKRPGMKFQ